MKLGLSVLAMAVSHFALGEIETIQVYRDVYGIGLGFSNYEKVDLTEDHRALFNIVPDIRLDGGKASYIRKVSGYPVPMLSMEGAPITNYAFSIKRGESVSWGAAHHHWGALSYISGKEIPAEIECPESYRKAEDVFHMVYKRMNIENVLFDPHRKKQFDIVCPREFDYPFFPHRKGEIETEYARHVKHQSLRICEMAKEKIKTVDIPNSLGESFLLSFPCDYGVCEIEYIVSEDTFILPEGVSIDPNWSFFRDIHTNMVTNIIVSAKNDNGRWKVSGVVSQPSYYAPRCYLLDEDGHLTMMHALDFKYPTQLDFHEPYRHAGLKKYDKDGELISGIPYKQLNREYEAKRDAAFDWQGDFTIERLLERVSQDAERIRKARNTAEALPR